MKNLKRKLLFISLLLLADNLAAVTLNESETRGKKIYTTGEGSSGKSIEALVGADATELPATSVPCVGCHGEDGKGRPEGNIVPPNITFEYLTLAYGHQHDNGRKHPAFTEDSFITAISKGMDSAGNQLDYAMPRYDLSDSDSADLIAYLKRLSSDIDEGLTDTTIRLATILPMHGELAELGSAIKDMLMASINELNAHGGIYNRKIQLEVIEYSDDSATTLNNVRHKLETDPVFALITPFSSNIEQELLTLCEKSGIPQIAPYTLFPEDQTARSPSTFYLLPGLNNEARAMVDYAVNELRLKNIKAIVMSPEDDNLKKLATTIEKYSQKQTLGSVTPFIYSSHTYQAKTVSGQLSKQKPEVIFFFGSPNELAVLVGSIKNLKIKPYIFISSSLTDSKVASNYNAGRIFISAPVVSREQGNDEDFFHLIKQNNLKTQHLTAQAITFSAVKLLVEGLQKTGQELSRKKLMQNMEHIYQFDTGVLPPLTYGENRHIGSIDVAIVRAAPSK